jgi:alpha-aminoadipate/glutamate carrier protein LysW
VVRCPKCAAEIDLDEDEVEEGELLNCPECDAGLEVVQTHPVQVNRISDDDDEDDDDEEESEEDVDSEEDEEAIEEDDEAE